MLRVDLKVPYSEKDSAKKLGAKWDQPNKTWYIELDDMSLLDFEALATWSKPSDMRFLVCPDNHRPYAQKRGAFLDKGTGVLYVPAWFAACRRAHQFLYRLCYWLPECPEFVQSNCAYSRITFREKFANPEQAARAIALNAGYTPIEAYLPEEKLAMDRICASGGDWYICNIGKPYYRLKIWDSY